MYNYADYTSFKLNKDSEYYIQFVEKFLPSKRKDEYSVLILGRAVKENIRFEPDGIKMNDKYYKTYLIYNSVNFFQAENGQIIRLICHVSELKSVVNVENKPLIINSNDNINVQYLKNFFEICDYKGPCMPIALAIVSGVPIKTIVDEIIEKGYKGKNKGTKSESINIITKYGYTYKNVTRNYTNSYRTDTITLKSILPKDKVFLIFLNHHIYAYKYGKCYDYQSKRFRKVRSIYEINKIEDSKMEMAI